MPGGRLFPALRAETFGEDPSEDEKSPGPRFAQGPGLVWRVGITADLSDEKHVSVLRGQPGPWFEEKFDIVTMVGTTVMEGKIGLQLLEKGFALVRDGGNMYYQSLDAEEDCNFVLQTAYRCGMKMMAFFDETRYGIHARYYKFQK